jgi:hypothetical protein
MDNGEEIPLLNEQWEFAGARLNEWLSGFVVMVMIMASLGNGVPGFMPLIFLSCVITARSMATLRKRFPDEERGVKNYFITLLGFVPPSIPAPSSLQPFWSGAPTRALRANCQYIRLGLDELFDEVHIDSDEVE